MTYNKNLLKCIPCNDLIRLGRNKDGGYLIPKRLLKKSNALISGGVFTDWSFESDFIKRSSIKDFFLIDKNTSIKGLSKNLYNAINSSNKFFIKAKCILHYFYNLPRVFIMRRFLKEKFIEEFIQPSIIQNREKKGFITINNLISKLKTKNKKKKIFLKLDIEGSEWEIFKDILTNLEYLSGIAIEVHALDMNGKKLENMINQFNSLGMHLVHVHPNNNGGLCENTFLPKLLELSFMSSQHLSDIEKNSEKLRPFFYNYKLDKPCDPSSRELFIN